MIADIEDLRGRVEALERSGPYLLEGVFGAHYETWTEAIADLYRRTQPVPVRERAARLFRAVAERLARSA